MTAVNQVGALCSWLGNSGCNRKVKMLTNAKPSNLRNIVSPAICVLAGAELMFAANAHGGGPHAYEAIGYLKYTAFRASGEPAYREVRMFDVQIHTNGWLIRTEPVIESWYFEASSGSNDSLLYVFALPEAYDPSKSPFGSLRAQLMESEKEAVHFMRDHPEYQVKPPPRSNTSGRVAATNRPDNVAAAETISGRYPPVDSHFIGLLWFAFTPPQPKADGTNRMLLQIWDDGHHIVRFWRATWSEFAEPPGLVSYATYNWAGREFRPDGAAAPIGTSASDLAADYAVLKSTNWMGLTLPLRFQVTRFAPKRSANGQDPDPRVLSTVVASVVRVTAGSGEVARVAFPGKTFVSDYRLSAGELKGTPLSYVVTSNSLPTVQEVKEGAPYRRSLRSARALGAESDDDAQTTRVKVGDIAPDFACQTISGEQFSLSDQKGKVVLVNFFATWCGPCMMEMPHLDKEIYRKFGRGTNFKLISIGREHNAAELKKWNQGKGLAFPVAPDPKREIYVKYAEKYIPRNFIIGKDGKVKLTSVGFSDTDFENIIQTIESELAK